MAASDSGSSHASRESINANADILVKQLDIDGLLASLLEERCVSFEQDVDRRPKLFADSGSSHASCERTHASADENVAYLIKQLDKNMLLAALLEEKCVSLKQDVERGQKLFAGACEDLIKYKVLKPLNYKEMNYKNEMRKQKEILDKIIQSIAQAQRELDPQGQEMQENAVESSREASQDAQLIGVKLK